MRFDVIMNYFILDFFKYSHVNLQFAITVGASGVRDFETVTFQTRTEPSRLFIKYHFKTVIRQRRIGDGRTGRKRWKTTPTRIIFALCYQ